MNFCAICEEKFTEWSYYAAHKLANNCFKKVLPIRTTNRTKAQIVADVEAKGILKGKLIQ